MTVTVRTVSPEGVVNSELDDGQRYQHAASLADGGYVVVWQSSSQDGGFGEGGVYSQRYSAEGARVGGETLVNTTTQGSQGLPRVAALSDGGYIVTWHSNAASPSLLNYQRYDGAGARVGGESAVELGAGFISHPLRAVGLADGGFVLAWAESTSVPSATTYKVQRYDDTGAKVGAVQEVSSIGISFSPISVDLTASVDGGYLVTSYGPFGVTTQHFNASGAPSAAVGWSTGVHAAALAGGGFAAAYVEGGRVFVQILDASGAKVGAPVLTDIQYGFASIAGLANGGFVIGWDWLADTQQLQAFDSAGHATGTPVLISEDSQTFDLQLIGLAGGGFVSVWNENGNSTNADVHQQLFGPSTVGATLTSAVEIAQGDAADDVFLVSAGALNPGDHISGGGGQDTVQLTTTGTSDFSGVSIAGVEKIVGTAGDDVLIFDSRPEGLISLESGGGHDVLQISAGADLADVPVLVGDWTVTGPGGPVTFYISGDYRGVHLDASSGGIKIEASEYALTGAERAALFADGVTQISQPGGYTFYSPTVATVPGAASQVNTTDAGMQLAPVIARLGDGYVVVWSSSDSLHGKAGIYAQRYDASGAKIGSEIEVNGVVDGSPSVTAIDGGFVVGWSRMGVGAFSQQFDINGVKVGASPSVLSGATDAGDASVAAIAGGYVVSWGQGMNHVFAQRYDNAGNKVGATLELNDPGGVHVGVDLASLADGGFVAVWRTGTGVLFQRFDSQGARVGAQATVTGSSTAGESSVAVLANGQFVVTWTAEVDGQWLIHSQRYDASGAAVGGVAHTGGYHHEASPFGLSAEALPGGGYMLVWTAFPDVYSQRYDASGAPVGEEVRLTPVSSGYQYSGDVAVLASGAVVAAWGQALDPSFSDSFIESNRLLSVEFVTLTGGADVLTANGAPRLVTTTAANFAAGDSLVGGSSADRLDLSVAGVLDLTAPTTFSGFEIIVGSGGDDRFIVSTARLAGVTHLFGGAGSDVLQTSAAGTLDLSGVTINGFETIEGSAGDDILIISPDRLTGVVSIVGGAGTDIIRLGAPGEATLDGVTWTGVETIQGSSGADTFYLTTYLPAGVGVIDGAGGVDRIFFGDSASPVTMSGVYLSVEEIYGTLFNDVLRAGDEGATLSGGAGDDTLYGGAGVDTLVVGAGSNLAYGGAGNDRISVGPGVGSAFDSNSLYGEAGADSIVGGLGKDLLDGGDGNDSLNGNMGDDVLVGGAGSDGLLGGGGDDILLGGIGNDSLNGDAGEDELYGGAGNDILRDGGETANRDFLFGGPGNDTYYVTSSLTGPLDLVYEGGTDPELIPGPNDLDVIHSAGTFFWDYYGVGETLYIDNVAGSQLIGGTNSQTIFGNNGYDQILVYGGSNRVDAGRGVDAISFGLYGLDESQDGVNTLVMKAGSGMDYIFEFESGVDKVDLSAFNFGITGAQVLAQAINVDSPGTDSDYCYFYLTSAGGVDNFVVFMGLLSSQLSASDFIT